MNKEINRMNRGQTIIENMIKNLPNPNNNPIIFDGPFDIMKYVKSQKRIMFILKEPNAQGVKYNDYKKAILFNDEYFGSMNRAAKGILTGNSLPDNGNQLRKSSIIRSTVFTNISNFEVVGTTPYCRLKQLYQNNSKILENKIRTYFPDIIICGNVYDTIVDSVENAFGGKYSRETNFYDFKGNVLPSNYNPQQNIHSTTAHYYLMNNGSELIVIDVFHPGAIYINQTSNSARKKISQDEWIAGIMNAVQNPKEGIYAA